MTTIAANRQEMAADSRTANEHGLLISDATQKIFRINGDLVGCEGDDDYIAEFLAWYKNGHDPETRPERIEHNQFGAIVLTSDGCLLKYFARCHPIEHDTSWLTLGSGEEIAAGALALGASPRKAVEAARDLNVWTGGPVQVERIG